MARDGGGARGARRGRRRPGSGCRARCTGSSRSTPPSRCSGRRSCGTTSARAPSARRSRSASGSSGWSQLTGNRALTGFTAPKLLWLRAHEPELYARIAHVLLPKDYVRLRLSGERAIDVADASGTLLFDVARRRWSDEVLDGARARPREWLPRALESPEVSGETRDGVPVAAGAGDQAAGALGVGVDRAGRRCRSCSARPASCSPRCRRVRGRPARRACTRSATRCPGAGTRWA